MTKVPGAHLPYAPDGDGVRLSVRITPRAAKDGFAGVIESADGRPALAVRLTAPPVDGAANKALTAFVASALGVPRSAVRIDSGESSRFKRLRIAGLSVETLARRLET